MQTMLKNIRLLAFWPLFGLAFAAAERLYHPAVLYQSRCAADSLIPFNELFFLPYLFWFVYIAGMLAFTFFREPQLFARLMRFIILTYTAALVIFFLFPTYQALRPAVFPRNNLLTRMIARFYLFDTNTNVCPSIHVIGAVAVLLAGLHSRLLRGRGWRSFFILSTLLICLSTLFVKQHSLLDVLAALAVCLPAYPLAFGTRDQPRPLFP